MNSTVAFNKNTQKYLPLIIVVFLTLVTVAIISAIQRNQEVRSRAAADTARLSFTPTTINTAPGGQFDVRVILDPGNQAIIGADILVQFDRTKLTLVNITPAVNATFKTYAPVTTSGVFDKNKVITAANNTGIAEFGLMAFDYNAGTLTTPTSSIISPAATLQFQAKTGSTGNSTINYVFSGLSGTTDSNVVINPTGTAGPEDILAAPTSTVAVTISSSNPSPSPSRNPSPSPSSNPPPPPSAGGASLTLKLKFEGVSTNKPNKDVKLTFKQNGQTINTLTVGMSANSSGVYTSGAITMTAGTYDLYINGPVHLQKKVSVTISTNGTTLDISNQPLLAGDAADNDKVDIFDYALLVAHFGPTNFPAGGSPADFNFDGAVNIFDYSFIVGNFNKTGDL